MDSPVQFSNVDTVFNTVSYRLYVDRANVLLHNLIAALRHFRSAMFFQRLIYQRGKIFCTVF